MSAPPFTPQQLQAAAATYAATGSAPSWWGSTLQKLHTSGSVAAPTLQTQQGQLAQRTAAAAQQAWLSRVAGNGQSQGSWTVAKNAQGKPVYVNTATGQTSYTDPNTVQQVRTPSVADVSQYLQSLVAGSGSAPPSGAQLAYQSAGSANTNWISGLNEFRLGSGSTGSYVTGSAPQGSTNPYGSAGSAVDQGSGRSIRYFDGSSPNTPTNQDVAKNTARSTDIDDITYSASINAEPKAAGPITTLLDLTNRDIQEDDLFPLRSEVTWFTRDQERRLLPFAPVIQETALRGPAAFGQRFTFDLGSIMVGDLLLGTALQIRLGHWLDAQTQNVYQAGKLSYKDRGEAWEYANSLGTAIIQLAELEIDGKTIEAIDGDFISVFNTLFPNYNAQVGIAYDHIGKTSIRRLLDPARAPTIFPVENGNLNCLLPFFFMRTRLKEAVPMIAIREGYVKIHITLRPFDQCVRQMRGFRDTCTSVPPPVPTPLSFPTCTWIYDPKTSTGYWDLPPKIPFIYPYKTVRYNWTFTEKDPNGTWVIQPPVSFSIASKYSWTAATQTWSPYPPTYDINYAVPGTNPTVWYYWEAVPAQWRTSPAPGPPAFDLTYGDDSWNSVVGDWSVASPPFKSVQLLTYGAIVDGDYRSKMLHNPFEILHRAVQTFYFEEPLKYSVGKRQDTIRIQLPLEANHPLEEIIWFIRRKGAATNNEWTNYTSVLESEWNSRRAEIPMLVSATIQLNGTVLCEADEQFYREGIAAAHKGGYAAYSRFIYGYSFAKTPGEHQPSGSMNASRLNALRLVLDVTPPGGVLDNTWEVKVFCIGLNWMRFENGLANPMFED